MEDVPADTPMPTPVPAGQYAACAAAISEGLCPACRAPFSFSERPWIQHGIYGQCALCAATWILSRDHIRWESAASGIQWAIETLRVPDGHVYGAAFWEE